MLILILNFMQVFNQQITLSGFISQQGFYIFQS